MGEERNEHTYLNYKDWWGGGNAVKEIQAKSRSAKEADVLWDGRIRRASWERLNLGSVGEKHMCHSN